MLDFFRGTLAPFLRASESPMAMACLRLFTRPPLPPLPERSVPRFLRRIALATVLPAALPYLRLEPVLAAIGYLQLIRIALNAKSLRWGRGKCGRRSRDCWPGWLPRDSVGGP